MIVLGENECISLSVLSVAQIMIALGENECISLSVLSVAQIMIVEWENECISLTQEAKTKSNHTRQWVTFFYDLLYAYEKHSLILPNRIFNKSILTLCYCEADAFSVSIVTNPARTILCLHRSVSYTIGQSRKDE